MKSVFAFSTIALVGSLALATPALAGPTVIDFEDNSDGVYWQSPIYSDGYTATEINNEDGTPLGTNYAIDYSGTSNGTIHLDSWTNSSSDSVWQLTESTGAAFSLSQFDFGSGYPGDAATASLLTLTGYLVGGGTVTQQITPLGQQFNTYLVDSSFTNLTAVTFDALGYSNRAAYDNIHVSTGAVPEPASWAMMVGGFGVVGSAMRRRKTAIRFA